MSAKAASMIGAMFLKVCRTLMKDPDDLITEPFAGSLVKRSSSLSSNALPLPFPVLGAPNFPAGVSFTSGGVASVGEEREEVGVGDI